MQTKKMVSESVSLYNVERPHLSLKYKTPDAVHRALELVQSWTRRNRPLSATTC